MTDQDRIEPNLPFYLTGERALGFQKALLDFKSGKPVNLFQKIDSGETIQGDLCAGFRLANLSDGTIKRIAGITLSNSCDVTTENKRDLPPSITFAPTMQLEAFTNLLLKSGVNKERVAQKLLAIREQKITDIFHLPAVSSEPERVAVLSQASSMPVGMFYEDKPTIKLRLSMLGHYLLMFKLSYHFCRMHEQIDRAV